MKPPDPTEADRNCCTVLPVAGIHWDQYSSPVILFLSLERRFPCALRDAPLLELDPFLPCSLMRDDMWLLWDNEDRVWLRRSWGTSDCSDNE